MQFTLHIPSSAVDLKLKKKMEGPTAKEMTPWLQTITSLVSRSECVQFSVDPQEQPKI